MNTSVPSWILVENLGASDGQVNGCPPTVIATGNAPRDFVGLSRRIKDAFSDSTLHSVTKTIYDTLADATSRVVPVDISSATESIHAHPVIGPDGTAFGVEIWVGRGIPPPRLMLGTFDYDCRTNIPRHGNGLDISVLGSDEPNDGVPLTVSSVWAHFSVFEREPTYFEYVRDIIDGEGVPGRTFHATIMLTGLDGDDRDVQMSTRSQGTRINGIVQVLHRYEGSTVTDRLVTRDIAQRFKNATGSTLGRVDLDTGIVKEWLSGFNRPFLGANVVPFDVDPVSQTRYRAALHQIANGSEHSTEIELLVRVNRSKPFTPVSVTLTGLETGTRLGSRSRVREGLLEVHAQLEVGGAW